MYAYDRYIVIHGCTMDCPWIMPVIKNTGNFPEDLASVAEENKEDSQTRSENIVGCSNLFNDIPGRDFIINSHLRPRDCGQMVDRIRGVRRDRGRRGRFRLSRERHYCDNGIAGKRGRLLCRATCCLLARTMPSQPPSIPSFVPVKATGYGVITLQRAASDASRQAKQRLRRDAPRPRRVRSFSLGSLLMSPWALLGLSLRTSVRLSDVPRAPFRT